jgi:hypothetical protein
MAGGRSAAGKRCQTLRCRPRECPPMLATEGDNQMHRIREAAVGGRIGGITSASSA